MKLQRHNVDNDRGEWCLSEDVEELEAENDTLRAELERLTGCLMGANAQTEHFEREWYLRGDEIERLKKPFKLLSAEEVTKDGPYWFQRRGGTAWTVMYVFPRLEVRDGLYIGPLTPPEL